MPKQSYRHIPRIRAPMSIRGPVPLGATPAVATAGGQDAPANSPNIAGGMNLVRAA